MEFKYNVHNEPSWNGVPHISWDPYHDIRASYLSRGLPIDDPQFSATNRRHFNPGASMRYAFPGQPGYTSSTDHPQAVPGAQVSWVDNGLKHLEARASGTRIPAHPVYEDNEAQSWGTTIDQRAFNSPRFKAAISNLVDADPSAWHGTHELEVESEFQHPDEGIPQWHSANMKRAKNYWDAHIAVQSGEFDHLEDPFEDTVRSRDVRPQAADKLSSQFDQVRGFIKLARD